MLLSLLRLDGVHGDDEFKFSFVWEKVIVQIVSLMHRQCDPPSRSAWKTLKRFSLSLAFAVSVRWRSRRVAAETSYFIEN